MDDDDDNNDDNNGKPNSIPATSWKLEIERVR